MFNRASRRRAPLAIGAALVIPSLAACGSSAYDNEGSQSKDSLTFAAIPAESSQSLQSDFDTLVRLLEKETGMDVEFQNASDYAAVIEGQRAGQIDLASFGPFSYIIAKGSGVPIEALAAPTNDEKKDPAYTSLAYVKQDSDISSLKDLKGKKVCFVDAASTSGYLVPMKGIMDEGLDMEKDMEPILAGGHDASLISLSDGNCDAAFAHDAMLQTLESTGQVPAGALKPIWESDPIPEDPIAINTKTVDPEVAKKITTALREKANKPALVEAGICESEADCVLPEEIEWGYRPVDDASYNPVREICDTTHAEACESTS